MNAKEIAAAPREFHRLRFACPTHCTTLNAKYPEAGQRVVPSAAALTITQIAIGGKMAGEKLESTKGACPLENLGGRVRAPCCVFSGNSQ